MKNFKLLLATTAILSMTTIAANAENLGTPGTINAEVTLKVIPTITGVDTLNFGNIQVHRDPSIPVEILGFTAEIDASTGEIDVSENATALDGHARGSIQIQNISMLAGHASGTTVTIAFSDIDTFTPAAGSGTNPICNDLEVTNIVSELEGDVVTDDGTYYFGGTLTVDDGGVGFGGPSLRCVGSGTATLVYTVE